ncbi:restriction endonuclease subunit S [Streptomyces sp. NPDC049627]|uniref:restriction endonuclease subunit S n=1 Tax=Streptomyces sp. NPDC049627 TaxID=3365595 RepID=UPI0037A0A095
MSVDGERELPAGWAWATLGELVASDGVFTDGDWVESKDQDPDGEVRLIQLADIGEGTFRDRSSRFLTAATADRLRCTYLEPGDVLIARMPEPLGRACLFPGSDRPAVTVVDVRILRPGKSGVFNRWLMWAINSPQVRQQISQYQTGTTRKRISGKNLAKVSIAVPPIAEQHRIVDALEEQLSRLDIARGLVSRARRLSGQLTGRYVANRLGELAQAGSLECPLGEVISSSQGGWSRAQRHLVPAEAGVPYLKMNNITSDGNLDLEQVVHVQADEEAVDKYGLEPGDVLFNSKNSAELVGKSAVVDDRIQGWVFNENITRIRFASSIVPEFAALQLNSPGFRRLSKGKASTNVAAIYMKDLRKVPFLVPSREEQLEIVAQCQALREQADNSGRYVDSAEARARVLRRRLLSVAFSGDLVPQDNREEPASLLLSRISSRPEAKPGKSGRGSSARSTLSGSAFVPAPTPATALAIQQEFDL